MKENNTQVDKNPASPEEHESYGLARFSRASGNCGKLFGSTIKHNHFIELTICKAKREREWQMDRCRSTGELISVWMSPSQFAELLTTMNCGEGVPSTIKHIQGKTVSECPETSFQEKSHADMKKEFARLAHRLSDLVETSSQLLSGPGALKSSEKATVKRQIEALITEVQSNIPFIHTCFQEAVDNTVTEAKAAVDGAVLHAQVVLGQEACKKLGLDSQMHKALE